MIILLALPRSGSTLTYQSLIHAVNPIYLSNLGNLLYQLPLLGGLFSGRKCKHYKSNFQSQQGFINGLCGPAEGLRYWTYWMDNGLDERNTSILSAKILKKRVKYIRKVFSFLGKPERPVVTGYLGHSLSVQQLQKNFPGAVFIRLNRDPLSNALSILNCREVDDHSWFSIFPKECIMSQQKSIHDEVASQVYWLNRRIDDEINEQQTIHINYEDLCTNPKSEINKVISFCNSKGMKLQQLSILPESFNYKKTNHALNTDIMKLKDSFMTLEKRYGKLTHSVIQ